MFTPFTRKALVAAVLACGLAGAQAQGPQAGGGASPGGLDLRLHARLEGGPARPGRPGDTGLAGGLGIAPEASAGGTHDPAPRVELLAGYDPYTLFDALDFKPRVGEYAIGIRIEF